MLADTGMTQRQFNCTLTIFFLPYAVLEGVGNVLMKRYRPYIVLPITMAIWGFCSFGTGFAVNFGGLMAGRFFLGTSEAVLLPAVTYYISCWYKRDETGVRLAFVFAAASFSGSFSALLSALFNRMDGVLNLSGWRWTFIIAGVLTFVVAISSFWNLHDMPDIVCNLNIMSLPDHVHHELLTVPPLAVASIVTIGMGIRAVCIACLSLVAIIGFSILLASRNAAAKYTALFIAVPAVYATFPLAISWVANNIEGSYKRGIVMGIALGWGNLNGVASCRATFEATSLSLLLGLRLCLSTWVSSSSAEAFCFATSWLAKMRLGAPESATTGSRARTSPEVHEMGDQVPHFEYTL
ncbi:major facilitator superfamily domain-containing protein [Bombardia bombarda]|uniref:Major facilitator superfamily domain-containing protein n=1 Tax=Bombardia bombarda TaxID=252184 RepID=A0AA39WUQ4_9PEZI|nr:major facilitator superfamily domain-containing protein [Bombardia bombarda]